MGNMEFIFRIGHQFDLGKGLDDLAPINERFKLGGPDGFRALVLWQYLKYLAYDYFCTDDGRSELY
jgi:hypothetical protein